VYGRYQKASREGKQALLTEFCLNTGYNRKYAIRLLNGPPPGREPEQRSRRGRGLSYGQEVLAILIAVWEAAGYTWSVRLKALLPLWMPWIRKRYKLRPEIEKQLLAISPRQMDRRLKPHKRQRQRRIYGHTKPGQLLKHHIPIKTDSWNVSKPGFTEIDLVSHSGNSADGEFAHTLNVTDIHTGWTESVALLGKSQVAVQQALDTIKQALPFSLRGVDSDNGSEFINWHLKKWCEQNQIQLTRGRPYKKDDNAHVEQKNWTHVRKLLGWERYDTREAVAAINELYRKELRLWLNLYLPSVKLLKKVRVGSKLRRKYSEPQTPFQRVWASSRNPAHLAELKKLNDTLDPFHLAGVIEKKLDTIYQLIARRHSPGVIAQKQIPARERAGANKTRAGKRLWKRRAAEK
jgi:transposase InsO family protein